MLFFGITYAIGMNKKSGLRDHWSTNDILKDEFVSKHLDLSRYIEIKKCIRFYNVEEEE